METRKKCNREVELSRDLTLVFDGESCLIKNEKNSLSLSLHIGKILSSTYKHTKHFLKILKKKEVTNIKQKQEDEIVLREQKRIAQYDCHALVFACLEIVNLDAIFKESHYCFGMLNLVSKKADASNDISQIKDQVNKLNPGNNIFIGRIFKEEKLTHSFLVFKVGEKMYFFHKLGIEGITVCESEEVFKRKFSETNKESYGTCFDIHEMEDFSIKIMERFEELKIKALNK